MSQFIRTANGTLVPTHRADSLRLMGHDEYTLHTIDGARYCVHDWDLSQQIIPNCNPDFAAVNLWNDEDGRPAGYEVVPIAGWRVKRDLPTPVVVGVSAFEADKSIGILDRGTGTVYDLSGSYDGGADAYLACLQKEHDFREGEAA